MTLSSPPSHRRRRSVHGFRSSVLGHCDAGCRDADTPPDACTCSCKGRNHGIRHRQGMADLFCGAVRRGGLPAASVIPASVARPESPCRFIKLETAA